MYSGQAINTTGISTKCKWRHMYNIFLHYFSTFKNVYTCKCLFIQNLSHLSSKSVYNIPNLLQLQQQNEEINKVSLHSGVY